MDDEPGAGPGGPVFRDRRAGDPQDLAGEVEAEAGVPAVAPFEDPLFLIGRDAGAVVLEHQGELAVVVFFAGEGDPGGAVPGGVLDQVVDDPGKERVCVAGEPVDPGLDRDPPAAEFLDRFGDAVFDRHPGGAVEPDVLVGVRELDHVPDRAGVGADPVEVGLLLGGVGRLAGEVQAAEEGGDLVLDVVPGDGGEEVEPGHRLPEGLLVPVAGGDVAEEDVEAGDLAVLPVGAEGDVEVALAPLAVRDAPAGPDGLAGEAAGDLGGEPPVAFGTETHRELPAEEVGDRPADPVGEGLVRGGDPLPGVQAGHHHRDGVHDPGEVPAGEAEGLLGPVVLGDVAERDGERGPALEGDRADRERGPADAAVGETDPDLEPAGRPLGGDPGEEAGAVLGVGVVGEGGGFAGPARDDPDELARLPVRVEHRARVRAGDDERGRRCLDERPELFVGRGVIRRGLVGPGPDSAAGDERGERKGAAVRKEEVERNGQGSGEGGKSQAAGGEGADRGRDGTSSVLVDRGGASTIVFGWVLATLLYGPDRVPAHDAGTCVAGFRSTRTGTVLAGYSCL